MDHRVFIVGFGLYGSSSGSSDYTASIELKESDVGAGAGTGGTGGGGSAGAAGGAASTGGAVSDSRRSLAENVCRFHSDGSSNTFQVLYRAHTIFLLFFCSLSNCSF